MLVRRVPLDQLSTEDVARWRALATRAAEPNVYLEPDYMAPLARAEADPSLAVLFVDSGDRTLLASVVAREGRAAGPLTLPVWSTSSDFMEREAGHTFPLVDRDFVEPALEAWFDDCRSEFLGGTVWFADLFADGPMVAAIGAIADRRGLPSVTFGHGYMPYLGAGDWPLPDPTTEVALFDASHLPRDRRQDMRRSLKRAEAALGAVPSWVDFTADPGAASDFVAFQSRGWKGDEARGGYGFALSAARSSAFSQVVDAYRDQGRLLVSGLTSGENVLYMSVSLQAASGTWCTPFDAYDEDFASLGIGRLGRLAVLRHLTLRSPNADIDPSFVQAKGSIGGVFPRQRASVGMLVGAGGFASRAAVRAIAAREARK